MKDFLRSETLTSHDRTVATIKAKEVPKQESAVERLLRLVARKK